MPVERLEDFLVWLKARDLAISIYKSLSHLNDYSLKDPISWALISILNTTTEEFDRRIQVDHIGFLYFAVSSNSEVRSMLYLSKKSGYLDSGQSKEVIHASNEASKMPYGQMKSVKNSHFTKF